MYANYSKMKPGSRSIVRFQRNLLVVIPEPAGRGLLIPFGHKRSQKSINNRGRMGIMDGLLTDLKNTLNNNSGSCLI